MYHIYYHNHYLCSASERRVDFLIRELGRHFNYRGYFFSDGGDVEYSTQAPTQFNYHDRKGASLRPWFPASTDHAITRVDKLIQDTGGWPDE